MTGGAGRGKVSGMSDSETTSVSKTLYFDHTEAFEREFKPQIKALLDRAIELGMPLFIAATVRDDEKFLETNSSNVGVEQGHSEHVWMRHAALVCCARQPPTDPSVMSLATRELATAAQEAAAEKRSAPQA